MRVEATATSVSWIPSEAVSGMMKAGFVLKVSHYDDPPPDTLGDLHEMKAADALRFANHITAWAEFTDGKPTAWEQGGESVMGATTVRMGPLDATFAAVDLPVLRGEPEIGADYVRVTQTTGGRTALPMPRRIPKPPYFRLQPPLVWTTLQLTLKADGTSSMELVGASPFPRHWVYDATGALALKAGLADYETWMTQPSSQNTPWGDEDSPVVVAAAETALERELSTLIMRGGRKPKVRELAAGDVLMRQGEPGDALYLVLDGVVDVSVDGRPLGDLGPGAVVGERAVLENGPRTATVTAITKVRVAEAPADAIDRDRLAELAGGHRRELTLDAEPQ